MKRSPFLKTVLLALALVFFFVTPSAIAQSSSSGNLVQSPEAEAYNKKALKKLDEMSDEEAEELDRKLSEALTLYYDREYGRALPIFKEISDRVETLDVMFWFASCAAKAGEADLSIEKFMKMLEIDPNLHRVRLELATVYFDMGRYDDARRALEAVLEARPPETVRNNIQKMLSAIDAKTKRLFTNARISIGIQNDRNVSAGPDKDTIEIAGEGGTIGPLTNTQRALRDWVTVVNMSGNALYDMGDTRDWMWNTTGSFYQTHGWEYYEFDYTQWRITTGPWLVKNRSVLMLPFGYAENIYGHDHLYDTADFKPSYEYYFIPTFSLRGMVGFSRDTYEPSIEPDNRSGEDNINRIWEINPNFYLNHRRDILSFYLTHENVNSKERRYTYDAKNLAVSYYKRFNWLSWDMEFYSRYKYTRKDYAEPALLWPESHLRRDKRHNFYLVLSRNFNKRYYASFSFNWIDNQSNTDLYDFNKAVYGLTMGCKF